MSQLAGSIWQGIDDESVQFDKDSLHSQFGSAAKKKASEDNGGDGTVVGSAVGVDSVVVGIGDSSKKRVEVVNLIDPKRAYAVNIGLARFRMTHAAIRDALLAMDEKLLDEDKLANLAKIMPTTEEIEIIQDYSSNVPNTDESNTTATTAPLGQPEQFFKVISCVSHVASRVQLLLLKHRFSSTVSDISAQLRVYESAGDELVSSKHIRSLCEYILAIGNYLNGGTNKGGAFAFKIEFLNKIKNTKSVEGQHSLLTYVVQQLRNTEIANFTKQIQSIHEAAKG